GWRGINRVTNARGAVYEYPRYEFSNRSGDIRDLFCKACDTLEIGWTRTGSHKVAVSRRPDVAKLDEVVGPKR
ncbi:MAG: helix-turn-helix domain-containing protein, partial [Actinomycetota bacterium]